MNDAPDPPPSPALDRVLVVVLGVTGGADVGGCVAALKRQSHKNMQVAYLAERSALETEAASAFGNARIAVTSMDSVGKAANRLLDRVDRFDVVVFLRDDVILDPNAIQRALSAFERTNASVVGAKVVSAENPDVLVEVGLSADRFGVPYSRLEGIELDQQQYDQARPTLFVSFAFFAVRRELLQAIDGFDPEIEGPGVELDFCWRARLAGGEVIYAPEVVARQVVTAPLHAEHAALVARNRLRLMFKVYATLRMLSVGFQASVITIATATADIFGGSPADARDAFAPWGWNLRHSRELIKARRATQRQRNVGDKDVTRYLVRGAAVRLRRADDATMGSRVREGAQEFYGRIGGRYLLLAALFLVFTLVAGRELITGDTPLLGKLVPPARSAVEGMGDYLAPWREVDVGTSAAAPPGVAVNGIAGLILVNSAAFAQKLLLLLGLPVAAVVCSRSLRPTIKSSGVRALAAAVYALGPLWWNALANGDLGAIAVAILLPTIARRLAHLTGLGAYKETVPPQRRKIELAILLAISTAVAPSTIIAVAFVLIGWGFASVLVGDTRRMLDATVGVLQAALGAFLLLLPWSFTLLTPSGASSAVSATVVDLSFLDVLRFDTGRFGGAWLFYGLVIGAFLPLLVVRGARFAWATRWWGAAVVSFFGTWLVSQGLLPALGDAEVLLAPAALAMAVLVGWGVDAFRADLPERNLGWVQPVTFVLVASVVVGMLSPLASLSGGRFGQPDVDWRASLRWQPDEAKEAGQFRNLFVGTDVPGGSRHVAGEIRLATSKPGGPTLDGLWLPPASAGTSDLVNAARTLASGTAPNAGVLLAPFGVRYVIVPAGNDALAAQVAKALDLREIQDDVSGTVFENGAWRPVVASLTGAVPDAVQTQAQIAAGPAPGVADAWQPEGRAQWSGTTTPDTLYGAVPFDGRFALDVGDSQPDAETAYGWALQYRGTPEADGTLIFMAGPRRPILLSIQLLLWLLVLSGFAGLRRRKSADPGEVLPAPELGL